MHVNNDHVWTMISYKIIVYMHNVNHTPIIHIRSSTSHVISLLFTNYDFGWHGNFAKVHVLIYHLQADKLQWCKVSPIEVHTQCYMCKWHKFSVGYVRTREVCRIMWDRGVCVALSRNEGGGVCRIVVCTIVCVGRCGYMAFYTSSLHTHPWTHPPYTLTREHTLPTHTHPWTHPA